MSITKETGGSRLLGYKLKQAQHTLRMYMDEALRTLNLTTPQYAVLAQLERRPGISNAALARASFITAQTMHGIVLNLEKNQLVQRKKDPSHGRILCTELTEKGLYIVGEAHQMIQKVEAIMTSTLTQQKRALLESLLEECSHNLRKNESIHGENV